MIAPEFDWILIGPDSDGLEWLQWSDADDKHCICMGSGDEVQARLCKILNQRTTRSNPIKEEPYASHAGLLRLRC